MACRLKYLFLISLLLILSFSAKFTKSYLTVSIEINEDGSASVKEEVRFRVEGSQDIDLYKIYLKSVNDLEGWRSRLNMDDIRYHLDQSYVKIYETKIYPSKLDTCDLYQTSCYGTFVFEYKIKSPSEGKGIVFIDKYKKPRIITYALNSKAFSFESTPVGSYLPESTTLEIKIPNSKIISLNPISVALLEFPQIHKSSSGTPRPFGLPLHESFPLLCGLSELHRQGWSVDVLSPLQWA
jgi:hypothetical protein